MKGTRTWNVAGRLLFLLAFAASAAVFWFARTDEGYMDLVINGVFDAVAALFVIIYFEGCARPLGKVVSSLRRVTEEIRSSRGGPEAMWERLSREQLFSNWRLLLAVVTGMTPMSGRSCASRRTATSPPAATSGTT